MGFTKKNLGQIPQDFGINFAKGYIAGSIAKNLYDSLSPEGQEWWETNRPFHHGGFFFRGT